MRNGSKLQWALLVGATQCLAGHYGPMCRVKLVYVNQIDDSADGEIHGSFILLKFLI